jgi:hypothetical protein
MFIEDLELDFSETLDADGEMELELDTRQYLWIKKEQAEQIIEHLQRVFGLKQEADRKKLIALLRRTKTLLSLINMNGQLRSGESVSLYVAIEKELENPGEQP